MPVLNRRLYEELCDLNKTYLRNQNLIIDEEESDIDLGEDHNVINRLIINERDIMEAHDKKYVEEKNKAKHINMLLISALALLGAGFTLASFFIVSPIIIPIYPVLLFGVAIVAITKFFLDLKSNRLGTEAKHAAKVLEQLKKYERVNGNGEEITNALNNQIQEIKNITMNVYEKIGELKQDTTQSFSQLMQQTGLFPSAIPIPQADPANEFHNQEARSSSPTHN